MLQVFLDNLAALICLSPLVGIATILLTSGGDTDSGKSSAVTSGFISLLFVVIAIANFQLPDSTTESSSRAAQMASTILWVGHVIDNAELQDSASKGPKTKIAGPDIRLSVGVTGVNQWYLLLVALTFFPMLLFSQHARPAAENTLVLLVLAFQASSFVAISALDAVLLFVGFELMGLLLCAIFAVQITGNDSGDIGCGIGWQAVSSLLILFGVAGVVATVMAFRSGPIGMLGAPTFSIPAIVSYVPRQLADNPAAAQFWTSMAPWIGLTLLFGLLIRIGGYPLQFAWPARGKHTNALGAMCSIAASNIAILLCVTVFLPLFASELSAASPYLCVWFSFSGLLAAIGTVGDLSPREKISRSFLAMIQLSLVGLFTTDSLGQMGAVFTGVSVGCYSVALLCLSGDISADTMPQAAIVRRNRITKVIAVCSFGVPIVGFFPGPLLVMIAISRMETPSVFWISLLMIAAQLVLSASWLFNISRSQSHANDLPNGDESEPALVAVIAAVLMLIVGLCLSLGFFFVSQRMTVVIS